MSASVHISNLITITRFCAEVSLRTCEFYRLKVSGRLEGLIVIDGCTFVDRANVNMHFHRGGERFRTWVKLGGRLGAVHVGRSVSSAPLGEGA